jgi:SNF2 family DNA or RNA helicase
MKLIFKTKPWSHQKEALKYLYNKDCAALYTKMGSGKTKVMIDLIRNRNFKRVLIVAPLKACEVWVDEIKTHGCSAKFHTLDLTKKKKEEKLYLLKHNLQWADLHSKNDCATVIIVNYESVWIEPVASFLLRKSTALDTIICDESHRIKSPSSKCSMYLSKLGKRVKHRYLVTGTPLAEKPEDVYAQYRFLDHCIFGTNFKNFCQEYQNIDVFRSSASGYTILDKKNPYKNLDKLKEKMQPRFLKSFQE